MEYTTIIDALENEVEVDHDHFFAEIRLGITPKQLKRGKDIMEMSNELYRKLNSIANRDGDTDVTCDNTEVKYGNLILCFASSIENNAKMIEESFDFSQKHGIECDAVFAYTRDDNDPWKTIIKEEYNGKYSVHESII